MSPMWAASDLKVNVETLDSEAGLETEGVEFFSHRQQTLERTQYTELLVTSSYSVYYVRWS